MRIFSNVPNIDFMAQRKLGLIVSTVLTLAAILLVAPELYSTLAGLVLLAPVLVRQVTTWRAEAPAAA